MSTSENNLFDQVKPEKISARRVRQIWEIFTWDDRETLDRNQLNISNCYLVDELVGHIKALNSIIAASGNQTKVPNQGEILAKLVTMFPALDASSMPLEIQKLWFEKYDKIIGVSFGVIVERPLPAKERLYKALGG